MPGRTVNDAIESFMEPLRGAIACLGNAHLLLTPGARGDVGEPHAWTLNGGDGLRFGDGLKLTAAMHFEVVDRGRSLGAGRFKVSTLSYLYGVENADDKEIIAAHWHPAGKSPIEFPHLHLGNVALSEFGVFLERAHIPSPRITIEYIVRLALESMGAEPTCDDWSDRLDKTERLFDEHKSWGKRDRY